MQRHLRGWRFKGLVMGEGFEGTGRIKWPVGLECGFARPPSTLPPGPPVSPAPGSKAPQLQAHGSLGFPHPPPSPVLASVVAAGQSPFLLPSRPLPPSLCFASSVTHTRHEHE